MAIQMLSLETAMDGHILGLDGKAFQRTDPDLAKTRRNIVSAQYTKTVKITAQKTILCIFNILIY